MIPSVIMGNGRKEGEGRGGKKRMSHVLFYDRKRQQSFIFLAGNLQISCKDL